MTWWRYLLFGPDELYVHRSWLKSDHLAQADAYTRRQLDQGSIVKDVAHCRRDAFWRAHAAKQQPRENVARFPDRVSQR